MAGDETSIWKKEITLRRKPKEGVRVPPAPDPAPRPDSVADLLRSVDQEALNPVVLPPVTPQVFQPLAPAVPPAPPAAHEGDDGPLPVLEPEPGEPVADESLADAPVPAPPPAPAPAPAPVPGPVLGAPHADVPTPAGERIVLPPEITLPPPVETPEPEAPPEPPKRRDRKRAERAARKLEKEQQRRARHVAREQRKAAPARHKQLVGLKIGASQIAAAQIVNKAEPRVVRLARMPLERGVVVGGELREPEELAAALKVFFRKNKLSRKAVRLGIANNRIGVRTFEISGIDDPKQLGNAIRFRAQETLPIPLDEAVLDYRILEDRVDEDGAHTRRVLLVVAHRELVERYVGACKKAGLKLVGIDLEAFALLRALGDPSAPQAGAEDAGLVCVSIGHDRTTLAVSDGHVCDFTRVLSWGGSSLDVALARTLDTTPSEAEPVKRELSLVEEGEAAGLDARQADAARKAMHAELQSFARELVASLRFYQEQPGSLGIGEILLTGGGAECGGLAEELEQLIGVTVRVADPLARIKLPRKLKKTAPGSASLAVAVGLGIED
jgi:type IV pilus assembly protein PilM